MKSIIVIPARLDSKRLPNKLIADINGKPMLKWVLESCLKSKLANSLFLCTDSNELASIAKDCNVQTFLTSSDCKSGTDRIASILKRLCNSDPLNKTLIINVQGDQPFIDPNLIDKMIIEFKNKDYLPEVITPVYTLNKDSVHNPNVVKTLLDNSHRAIYFSRSAIPHIRDVPKEKWFERYAYYGHVGIYGYRADILMRWSCLLYTSPSPRDDR